MRRLFAISIAAVAAVGVFGLLPLSASAHALLVSSTPANGATVQMAPAQFVGNFSEKPLLSGSSITIVNAEQQPFQTGPLMQNPSEPTQLSIALKPMPKGVYSVTWCTTSAVDSHHVCDRIAFGVGVAATATVPTAQNAIAWISVVGKIPLYIGLIVMLGAAVMCMWVFPLPQRRALLLLPVTVGVAGVGTILTVIAELVNSSTAPAQIFATPIGFEAILRLLPLVVIAAVLTISHFRKITSKWPFLAVGLGAVVAMFIDVLHTHAAAGSAVVINVAAQTLHIGAVGVWIGGLATMLLCLPTLASGERFPVVWKFSGIAGFAMITVGLSGVLRAFLSLQMVSQLWTSLYGQLICVKVILFLVVAGLGGLNRYRNVPKVSQGIHSLRKAGGFEVLIATVVVVVAATLVNAAPPVTATGGNQSQAIVLTKADFTTSIRLRLTISPGTAGFNHFDAQVLDYTTNQPVKATSVILQFAFGPRPELGTSSLNLTSAGIGHFVGDSADLSFDGVWGVEALVQQPNAAYEVQYVVVTHAPPQPTSHIVSGALTIEIVSLPQGYSAQLYLDPGTAGKDELHMTFFDPSQAEYPITAIVVTQTVGGVPTLVSATRELEPGHFVADVTVPKGITHFDISGVTGSGKVLSVHADLSVPQ